MQVCSQFYFEEVHDIWLLLMTPDQEIKHPKDIIILWENLLFVTARSGGSYYLLHPKSLGRPTNQHPRCKKKEKIIHRYKFQIFHELLNTSM
jgi:hypothetical protein